MCDNEPYTVCVNEPKMAVGKLMKADVPHKNNVMCATEIDCSQILPKQPLIRREKREREYT